MFALQNRQIAVLFKWPLLIGELITFGSVFFTIVAIPRKYWTSNALCQPLLSLWRALTLLLVLFLPAAFLHQVAIITDLPWRTAAPLCWEAVKFTFSGRIWAARLFVSMVLAYAVCARLTMPMRLVLLAGTSAILLLLECLSGHAIDQSAPMLAVYCVHTMSTGFWCGALVTYLLVSQWGNALTVRGSAAARK